MAEGFIKLSRKLLEWGWTDDPNVFNVWVHLLLMANWKVGTYHGTKMKPGQLVTSVRKLSEKTGLTTQQIRTALAKLKSTNEIELNQQAFGTLITIIKWAQYQVFEEVDNKRLTNGLTNNQQTINKQSTNQYRRKKEGKKERIKNSASSSPNIYAPGWVDRSGKTRKELEAELNELLNPKRDS